MTDPADDLPPGRRRRTWPQRLALGLNLTLALACVAAALAIFIGQKNLEDVQRVDAKPTGDLTKPAPDLVVESLIHGAPENSIGRTTTVATGTTAADAPSIPAGTVKAENFLMTGSDSRDCIDPKSPYAGAFLNGATGGSRPDTIMVLRTEPDTGKAAILSFPRDLWVPIAGTTRRGKINSVFDKKDPTTLIATIQNFAGITIDHYINIDFCVFKDLVDAVGGVTVPFSTPVRDKNTGLDVEQKGCFSFTGDHALAYVRSRHIQYQDDQGRWHDEGSADIGRIRRQQDFVRRVMQKVRSKGLLDLRFVKKLTDSFQKRVEVDLDLTADDVLRLADAMRSFDPATTRSFIIEGSFGFKGNAAVIDPHIDTPSMQAILRIFSGEAAISDGPNEQDNPVTTAATGDTVAVGDNAETAYGAGQAVVPDKTVTCP